MGLLAAENTLEAFTLAWDMGLIPESDLRMTRDGVLVPFHDDDFSRVVRNVPPALKHQGVQDLNYTELARLDVGAGNIATRQPRRVLPMSNIFALMEGHPHRRLYMDIKHVDLPRLAHAVRQHDLEHQVILASRLVEQLRAWRALIPNAATLLWVHGNEAEIARDFLRHRQDQFAGITQLQLHIYPKLTDDPWAPPTDASGPENPFRLSNHFLRATGAELRERGILYQAFPFTVDPSAYGQLLDLGVMSFATDHPDVALCAIEAYYRTRSPRH